MRAAQSHSRFYTISVFFSYNFENIHKKSCMKIIPWQDSLSTIAWSG